MILSRLLVSLVGLDAFASAFVIKPPSEFPEAVDSRVPYPFQGLGTRDDITPPPKGRQRCALGSLTFPNPSQTHQDGTEVGDARKLNAFQIEDGNSTHVSMRRRDMTWPENGSEKAMIQFMRSETSEQEDRVVWEQQIKGGDAREVNTSRFKPFLRKRNQESMTMIELAGCTGLVIVSRRGAFAAHYWENIGFNIDPKEHGDLYKSQLEAFQKSIIDPLYDGIPKQQDSLKKVAKTLSKDNDENYEHIQAYLMIPSTGNSDIGIGPRDPYREKWERIKEEVGKIIPALQKPERWHEYAYDPVQDEEKQWKWDRKQKKRVVVHDPLWDTVRGRLVLKFDPKHKGKKKIALWMEDQLMLDEEWVK